MFKVFWLRALVVVAVTGGAYLLGRAWSHRVVAELPTADVCAISASALDEQTPATCMLRCQGSSSIQNAVEPPTPFATAEGVPTATPVELETPLTPQQVASASVLPHEPKDVIVIRLAAEAVPQAAPADVTTFDDALLAVPDGDAAASGKNCPAFMPYIDDEQNTAGAGAEFLSRLSTLLQETRTLFENAKQALPSFPDVSRYEHLFPKPDRDKGPARTKLDSMEFRPSDGRPGDFGPRPF